MGRQRRRSLFVYLAVLALVCGIAGLLLWQPWISNLVTITQGGKGPPTFVLLHGYGSSAERWIPYAKTIRFPPEGRFVFPQAPERTVPPDGPSDGRAWWRLDLASRILPGQSGVDLSATRPQGIVVAASLVRRLLRRIKASPGGPIILGGFSQGAMVAGEVAFLSDEPIFALVLLSGTTVDEQTWERNYSRRRGLPVFLSHGRSDNIFPFAIADHLHTKLEAAGVAVTWCPFDGGHEIPSEVVVALGDFLEQLPLKKNW